MLIVPKREEGASEKAAVRSKARETVSIGAPIRRVVRLQVVEIQMTKSFDCTVLGKDGIIRIICIYCI